MGAGGQLDPFGDAVEPDVIDAVTQELVREMRTVRSWRGPIPPASELAAYDDVVPGAAERILRMSEQALDAQADVDTALAHGDVASVRRGQWQSTAVVGMSLVGAFALALAGLPWGVVAVFVAPPVFEFAASLVRAIREPRRDSDGQTR